MTVKTAKKLDYSARNREKLGWLVALAPFAVVVPVLLGAAVDGFVLYWDRNAPQGMGVLVFIADLSIGIWQGILLGRGIAAMADKPPSFGEAVFFFLLRGLFIGGLTGTINGLIMYSLGWQFVLFSGGIGLAAGAALGLLAGLVLGSVISKSLEKEPRGAEAAQ